MYRPKEYLVSIGALPPGSENARGRLSKANDQLCKDAAAKGINILGYAVSTVPSKPTAANPKPTTRDTVVSKSPKSGNKEVVEPAPYTYPEDSFEVYEWRNGRKVLRSMREACNNCRVSLVGHACADPRIVAHDGRGSVQVIIERKSA